MPRSTIACQRKRALRLEHRRGKSDPGDQAAPHTCTLSIHCIVPLIMDVRLPASGHSITFSAVGENKCLVHNELSLIHSRDQLGRTV